MAQFQQQQYPPKAHSASPAYGPSATFAASPPVGLPHFGGAPPVPPSSVPQGTLAPGTIVRVGAYTVRVERFLSEGKHLIPNQVSLGGLHWTPRGGGAQGAVSRTSGHAPPRDQEFTTFWRGLD